MESSDGKTNGGMDVFSIIAFDVNAKVAHSIDHSDSVLFMRMHNLMMINQRNWYVLLIATPAIPMRRIDSIRCEGLTIVVLATRMNGMNRRLEQSEVIRT